MIFVILGSLERPGGEKDENDSTANLDARFPGWLLRRDAAWHLLNGPLFHGETIDRVAFEIHAP
jgi:hypothetical protein